MRLASRLDAIQESVTLAIAARAAELRSAGQDVISLAAGEPDFAPPEGVRRAAHDWIDSGNGRYTPTSGILEIRDVLAREAARKRGLDLDTANILISAGTKPALFVALLTILEPGDEVLILAPYWVSYPDLVRLAGGVPRFVHGDPRRRFAHDADEIRRELGRERCRVMILNSPNNPTGRVYRADEMQSLVEAARSHDAVVLSDEIYSTLTYGTDAVSPAAFDKELASTIVCDGLSKSHAIPGWRVGCMIAAKDVIRAAGSVQSQMLGNACSISQQACAAAFDEATKHDTDAMVEKFARRRDLIVREIESLEGFESVAPEGAFFALSCVREVLDRLDVDDVELSRRILDEAQVALVPGSAFGAPGHLRFSFANASAKIEEAFERLRTWLTTLRDTTTTSDSK